MRYQPPYGVSSPDAHYINGDPSQGQQGSIPPAAAFEQPQKEIVGVIEKSGFTTSDTDWLQLAKGVRSQRLNYAVDTGTPRNLTAAFDPPFNFVTNPYTPGLTLHVKVKYTNVGAGQVSIEAGGGRVPIRKMNNSEVGDSELPQGCIATLIYDAERGAFQLTNYGGAGGDTNVQEVNVPYCIDSSTTPGEILADFGPTMPLPLVAGNIIAVKVANTSPGATQMFINTDNTGPAYDLAPNGGGIMLQGDAVAGDVVQFFYDGNFLFFVPNPEINAPVTYTVGPGQQFPDVRAANNALLRKTVGAGGRVTLQMIAGVFGHIDFNHPSADRIVIRGTMFTAPGVPPALGEFTVTGSSAAARANDATRNLEMLRTKYRTEILIRSDPVAFPPAVPGGEDGAGVAGTGIGNYWFGIRNKGPGRLRIEDLLVVGGQRVAAPQQYGPTAALGFQLFLQNVAAWGCETGFYSQGSVIYATDCFASASMSDGWSAIGNFMQCTGCGSFGNGVSGFHGEGTQIWLGDSVARGNGVYGIWAVSNAGMRASSITATGNGTFGAYAWAASSIIFTGAYPIVGITSPLINDPNYGNLGSIITLG